jgi:hypothetical protein
VVMLRVLLERKVILVLASFAHFVVFIPLFWTYQKTSLCRLQNFARVGGRGVKFCSVVSGACP